MFTLNQLLKKKRKKKIHKSPLKALKKCPQKKGICIRVYTTKPKKPNSAIRKVAKVKLSTGRSIICGITGQGHNIHDHSIVLVRGGRIKDVPGVRFQLIRGIYDFSSDETFLRKKKRSKHGISKIKKRN